LDVDATVANVSSGVTPESVQADAKVTLGQSTIGGVAITRANVDGTYHDSTGEIRAFELVGRDVNAQASGAIALNETGQSNLKIHADSPSLDEIGKLFNQPIAGIGKVDATVTGNRRELQAVGNVTGNGVKYHDNGALTITSDFTAKVPDLAIENAHVVANTRANFITVGGQNINELEAKTTYEQKRVAFDISASQPQRTVGATGALVLHPDHQEVHLQTLGLTTQGQTWQMASGSEATIKYGSDSVTVTNMTLTSVDQQISADGTFGRPGDAMHVKLANVDLANVDALLLRPPQLTGRVNASGTITGTKDAPEVKADFQVSQGGFREYRYETLAGSVNYSGPGLTVDARLQQNPTTFITAKGYLPATLFKSGAMADRDAAHGVTVAKADQIDFHIESTPIDLGLIQGVTTALTDVTGTLQANIDITGSAADPHPNGVVSIDKAAFTVVPTGVSYSHLQGTLELQPDKIHITHISVLDNHQSSLSLTGDLALHERQVGGVEIYVTANDFKVIDNKMGNVRINSNLEIAGELRSPRLLGDLGVSTGRINLDEIIALVGDSPSATNEAEYLTPEEATAAKAEPPAPSMFDAMAMDVRLTVPDDLVVRANELRTPGSP